jgi:hypothetical protein
MSRPVVRGPDAKGGGARHTVADRGAATREHVAMLFCGHVTPIAAKYVAAETLSDGACGD